MDEIVLELEKEIKGGHSKEKIESYETKLSKEVEKLSKIENFFNLPLNNIFSVISKVDFDEFDDNEKILNIIQSFIKNTIKKHSGEKETILILQNLNTKTIQFSSHEEIFTLLDLITNCPILVKYCNLYKEMKKLADRDYDFELKQKDEEIKKLKEKILSLEPKDEEEREEEPIELSTDKPGDLISDIFLACKEGKLSSVKYLIEKEKIKPDIPIEKNNYELEFYANDTPIHIASKYGHLEIVKYLIEDQNIDKDIKGNYDSTPLHYACQKGFLSIIDYLISKDANIEAEDSKEQTPIYYAFGNKNQIQVLDCLIKEGANIEAIETNEKTPLHVACEEGRIPIVQYLISKGANIEAKDIKGKTPLHFACENGNMAIVEFLLLKGANINAKDYRGNTSLHFASNFGHTDIVEFLISKGASFA